MAETFSKIINVTLNLKKGAGFSGSYPFVEDLRKALDDIDRAVKKGVNITPLVAEIEKLSNLQAPNLKQLATGFDLLAKHLNIGNIPNFDPLVTQIKKLAAVGANSIPKLGQFGEGLRKITEIKNVGALNAKIVGLSNSLRNFEGIKLPNLINIGVGLERFATIKNIGAQNAKLVGLSNSLRNFEGIKLPNLLSIANGLEKLSRLGGIGAQNAKLVGLSNALKNFSRIKLPPFSSFISGLEKLVNVHNVRAQAGKLNTLRRALSKFTGIKLPSLTSLVNGLNRLAKINMSRIDAQLSVLVTSLAKLQPYASMINNLGIAFSKLKTPIDTAKRAIQKETETLNKFQITLRSFFERIRKYAGYYVISRGIQALTRTISEGIKAIVQYDQGLKNLQAITQATGSQVSAMGDKIKQVASDTKFSASEVADGMVVLGQAGLSAKETIQAIGPVADLATATLSGMKGAVDLVTTALEVFNINAKDTTIIADIFASAVTNSKLTIDKLRTSFNFIGPIAVDAGISFKETAAALSILANSGLRASKQATSFRALLVRLLSPSDKLTRAANKAGVSLKDIDPTVNSLSHVLINLRKILFDTETGLIKAGLSAELFGKRGVAGVLALVDAAGQMGPFDQMLAKMDDIGLASRMADKQLEGLGTGFKNLQDKAKNLAIALGEAGLTKALKVFLKWAKKATEGLTKFVETDTGKFTVTLIALAGAFITITTSLGLLLSMMSKVAEFASVVLVPAMTALALTPFEMAALLTLLTVAVAQLLWSANAVSRASDKAANSLRKFQKAVNDEDTTVVTGLSNLKRFKRSLKDISKVTDDMTRGENIAKMFNQLFQAFPRYTKEIDNTERSVSGLKEELKRLTEHLTDRHWDNAKEKVKLYSKQIKFATSDLKKHNEELATEKSSLLINWISKINKKDLKEVKETTAAIADDNKIISNKYKAVAIIFAAAAKAGKDIGKDVLLKQFSPKNAAKIKTYMTTLANKTDAELSKIAAKYIGESEDTVKGLSVAYKDVQKQRQVDAAQSELYISSLVAKGVITAKEGEKEKLVASRKTTYDQMRDAQQLYDLTESLGGQTAQSKGTQAAFKALKTSEKDYYESSIKLLDYYGKEITSTEKDRQRNISDRTKLEEKYGKTVDSIQKKIASNVQKYNAKIVSLEQKLANDRINLEDNVSEEIRKINQKGLTDKQKQTQDEQAAYTDLNRVKKRLAKALSTGNVSDLENLKGLLGTAHQLFGSLSDKDKAVAGLKAYKALSEKVLIAVADAKEQDAYKEVTAANNLLKIKLDAATKIHSDKLLKLKNEFEAEVGYIKKLKDLQSGITIPKAGESPEVEAKRIQAEMEGATTATGKLAKKGEEAKQVFIKFNGVITQISKTLLKGLDTKLIVDRKQLDKVEEDIKKDKIMKVVIKAVQEGKGIPANYETNIARAAGGLIPFLSGAKRGIDSIRAILTPGEYVIKEPIVRKLGTGFFDAINNFRMPQFAYAAGGSVGGVDLKSSLGSLSNMGSVSLELGNTSYPVIGNQNVISTLVNHLQREKLMRSN